jgi:hypothetical protein
MAGAPGLRIIGLSKDGAYLAFESFGRSTVSGAPFSTIAVMDTRTNEMVDGAPFRVALWGTEWGHDFPWPPNADLVGLARDLAWVQALSTLQDLGVVGLTAWRTDPTPALGATGRTIIDAPPEAGVPAVLIDAASTLPVDALVLTARRLPFPQPEHCPIDYVRFAGIELVLERPAMGRSIHRDAAIPRYRGCPVDYAIREVLVFDAAGLAVVVLYSFWPFLDGIDQVIYTAIALPLAVNARLAGSYSRRSSSCRAPASGTVLRGRGWET